MGETNTTLPCLLPGPSQVPSAHHRSFSTSPGETQRVLGKQGNPNTQCRDTTSTPTLLTSGALWWPHRLRGVPAQGYRAHRGVQGKSIWGLHTADYGVFRAGTNIRERDGYRWFAEEQICENIGIKEWKRLVVCKLGLVIMSVWPCPVPD